MTAYLDGDEAMNLATRRQRVALATAWAAVGAFTLIGPILAGTVMAMGVPAWVALMAFAGGGCLMIAARTRAESLARTVAREKAVPEAEILTGMAWPPGEDEPVPEPVP